MQVIVPIIFSGLVLIALIVQASIYKKQAFIMDSQLKLSDQTFKLLERPSLGVVSVGMQRQESGAFVAIVTFQNSGHIPARLVKSTSGTGMINPRPEGLCPEFIQDPSKGRPSVTTVAINARAVTFAEPLISPQDFEAIKSGDKWLFIYFRATYGGDGVSAPYFTEGYGRYNPITQGFDTCGTHNDAN